MTGGDDRVVLQYTKYPATEHWRHDLVHLGEDEHGVWLGMREGTYERPGEVVPITTPFVQLVAPDRWWTVLHNGPDHRWDTYVDVCTPVCWADPGRGECIDLDLDVVRDQTGGVQVLDLDEFADHQVRHAYPPELIDGARRGAAEVVQLLRSGTEPFATRQQAWRDHLVGAGPRPA